MGRAPVGAPGRGRAVACPPNPRPAVSGRRLQPLAELRAEYGQMILDDAGRDPVLAEILDEYAGRIAAEMTEPKGNVGIGKLERLTAYVSVTAGRSSPPVSGVLELAHGPVGRLETRPPVGVGAGGVQSRPQVC